MLERNNVVEVEYITLADMEDMFMKHAPGGEITKLPVDFIMDIIALTDEGYQLMEVTPALFQITPFGGPVENFAHVCESYIRACQDSAALGEVRTPRPEQIQDFCLDLRRGKPCGCGCSSKQMN
jgi:hypothetical protein